MVALKPMDDVKMDMGAMVAALASRWLRIILVTLILLVITYVMLLFVPKLYQSTAGILVESRQNAYTRAATDQQPTSDLTDDTTISSQIELIKSRGTLMQVIEAENLRDEPEFNGSKSSPLGVIYRLLGRAPSATGLDSIVLANVADQLKVVRERDSRIISIEFQSTNPDRAARIANAVANIYVQRRGDLSLSDTADASAWLLTEIDQLRVKVSEAESKVAAYRVDNDLFTGTNDTSLLDQQLSSTATQISAAQERKNSAQSKATLIRGLLKAGQPIDSVPDVRQSVVVQQLSEEKARLQGERAQQLSTLLPNHPTIKALSAQIDEIDKQIKVEGRQVASTLEAEAEIEAGVENSLREELARLKVGASTATRDTVSLNELEREAKAQRDLLETYLLRYRDAAARTQSGSALPDVRVISAAAAAINPSSPQTKLIMGAVLFVSIMLQLGQILFAELISGRALTSAPEPAPRQAAPREEETDRWEPDRWVPDEPQPAEPDLRQPEMQKSTLQRALEAGPEWNEPVRDLYQAVEMESAQPVTVETFTAQSEMAAEAEPEYEAADEEAAIEAEAAPDREQDTTAPAPRHNPLADRIAGYGQKLVLACALNNKDDCRPLIESLSADLLTRGLSAVEVDAGSRHLTTNLGISDLCAGAAGFGEVVHRGQRTDFAVVPWGQQAKIDFGSRRCLILVEALADIFEIVLVDAGRIGLSSSLPAFAGRDSLVLLVVDANASSADIEAARADIQAIGFDEVEVVDSDTALTQVA